MKVRVGKLNFLFTSAGMLAHNSSQNKMRNLPRICEVKLKCPTHVVEWGRMRDEDGKLIIMKIGKEKEGKKVRNKRERCKRHGREGEKHGAYHYSFIHLFMCKYLFCAQCVRLWEF